MTYTRILMVASDVIKQVKGQREGRCDVQKQRELIFFIFFRKENNSSYELVDHCWCWSYVKYQKYQHWSSKYSAM